MRGDFCPSRPALHGLGVATSSARSPSKAGGPVLLPDGRVTRRFTSSTRAAFAARGFRQDTRLQGPPETRVPYPTPQAPLPARTARHGNRTTPFRWAGMSQMIGIFSALSTEFSFGYRPCGAGAVWGTNGNVVRGASAMKQCRSRFCKAGTVRLDCFARAVTDKVIEEYARERMLKRLAAG